MGGPTGGPMGQHGKPNINRRATGSTSTAPAKKTHPQQKPTSGIKIDDNTRILAAVVYGESSTDNLFEEMSAIASVIVRQQNARRFLNVSAFIRTSKTFAYAAHDGKPRYKIFMSASDEAIARDTGMSTALKAAQTALFTCAIDYSNGACFWDGIDIKTNYKKHPKVAAGIHFTDPAHNIFQLEADVTQAIRHSS